MIVRCEHEHKANIAGFEKVASENDLRNIKTAFDPTSVRDLVCLGVYDCVVVNSTVPTVSLFFRATIR